MEKGKESKGNSGTNDNERVICDQQKRKRKAEWADNYVENKQKIYKTGKDENCANDEKLVHFLYVTYRCNYVDHFFTYSFYFWKHIVDLF